MKSNRQISIEVDSWIAEEDLPVHTRLKVIKKNDPNYGLTENEIRDCNEFIRSYLRLHFKMLTMIRELKMYVFLIKTSVRDLFPPGQGRGHLIYRNLNSMGLGGEKMLFDKIISLAKEHGWKQQNCGIIGISGSPGTNFYKDGKVLTLSMVEEGTMTYPDEDELREMFGVL